MLILDICQHSYLKNSKSAPVSQYQLWMSLHKCACLPAGKTENPRAANPAHLHPEEKTKQISFNRAWEIIMENKTKKHTNISVPRASCHLFCPGKTAQWYSDWHFSNRRKSKAQTTAVTVLNTKSKWGLSPIARYLLQYQHLSYHWQNLWAFFLFVRTTKTYLGHSMYQLFSKAEERPGFQTDEKHITKWTILH